ncbi:hypothetical protein GOP47_0026520 [Adiantum capillus-veneris]|nr:hypothetical protein GOP47_0026520 [Adiantum capillus-veneris]
MLAEAHERANFVDDRSKMHTLASTQLPDLIKSFELKVNQQKDVTQVKFQRPAGKIKLRDPQEVLEIARLKVLISEMREKTMKMEAQLKSEAEKWGKDKTNSSNVVKDHVRDEANHDKHIFIKNANTQDFTRNAKESGVARSKEDLQAMSSNENKKSLVDQGLKLDHDLIELQKHLANVQSEVNRMLVELSSSPDLHEELTAAKERIKGLQEAIKDDASTTKSQLLVLKQQFGELEKLKNASERKELEFQKASQISSALESELAELRRGNEELLMQKKGLSKKLSVLLEKAEKIKPVTKDDVLASKAEVHKFRSTNVELQKKVESLQMSRFNEVEEVVYLRWVNACLRHDLDVYKSSRQNSNEIVNEIENCSPIVHGNGDLTLCTYSHCSSASHNNALGNSTPQNDRETMQGKNESRTSHNPQTSSPVNSIYSSPTSTKYSQRNIHVSPLAIPHGDVSRSHSSPLVSPFGHVDRSDSSPPLPHADGSHLFLLENPLGRLKSSHASPKNSLQGVGKTKSGVPYSIQQQSPPSNSHFPQSSNAYNALQHSPRSMTQDRDPQKTAEIQSKLTFNHDRSSTSDATSYMTLHTHNSLQRLGRSFTRSASTLSASFDGSTNRTQGRRQIQDRQTFRRSSSTLCADSDIPTAEHNLSTNPSLRRHSASSVMEPAKRKDSTGAKAHSFEIHLDPSNRVVAAFQKLSASSPTKNAHQTFKDLSRRNSHDYKAESKAQQHDEHDAHKSTERPAQVDFICDLARAIQVTHYSSIEQISAFVNWFERQGEVDKQEFFGFPDFPRDKVEAMRRAVYEHEELKALETELHTHQNELKGPADLSVQDMKTLLEKVENYIQGFKQARELAIAQFSALDIPTAWMLDSGMIAKIKLAALQLAQRFIQRVTILLTTQAEPGRVSRENLLLEAARFLLQVHNFAGGFDEKTANAFKLLQSQADLQSSK